MSSAGDLGLLRTKGSSFYLEDTEHLPHAAEGINSIAWGSLIYLYPNQSLVWKSFDRQGIQNTFDTLSNRARLTPSPSRSPV